MKQIVLDNKKVRLQIVFSFIFSGIPQAKKDLEL